MKSSKKQKKRITIKDIAAKANVSRGTVDRVIHNRGSVAPDIKEKILSVIKDLNYQTNIIASTLAYNRDFVIGVLIPNIEDDPFWDQPRMGIEKAISNVAHYGVHAEYFYYNQDETASFVHQSNKLIEYGVDAVILAPDFYQESMDFMDICLEQKIPYIQINTYLNRNENFNLGYVGQDSYQSGMLAGRLIESQLRHQSQVCVMHLEDNFENAHHLTAKEKGFRDYFENCSEKGVEIIQLNFPPLTSQNELYAYLNNQLKQLPFFEAIFVTTSRTYMIAEYLEEIGNDKTLLLGFDLIPKNIQYLSDGKIDFLINQNPLKQGYLGTMNIVEHLIKKEKIDAIINVPLDIVVKENYQYYLRAMDGLKIIV